MRRGPIGAAGARRLAFVGCGILRKEVEALVRANGWDVGTRFLPSALHHDFDRLSAELEAALDAAEREGLEPVVLYGCCHPAMDGLLERHHTLRTRGQNCIAWLLGHERFMEELSRGAFFLLEDWARTWEPTVTACLGPRIQVVREIFHGSHRCIVALRTPTSGEFTAEAEAAARLVDLPLEWMDVDLGNLEAVLADALARKRAEPAPP